MSEQMRAAKLIAESVGALLEAAAHIAGAGGLKYAHQGSILDCSNRVYRAIEDAENVSAVEKLGDLADDGA